MESWGESGTKYLGSLKTADGYCEKEIGSRI